MPGLIEFTSNAFSSNSTSVSKVEGVEGISKPFEFVIDFVVKDGAVDFASVFTNLATLTIKVPLVTQSGTGLKPHKFYGIISQFEQLEKKQTEFFFRATMVPRFWQTKLNHRSRVFLDKNIPDIIAGILQEHNIDCQFSLTATYPVREYVVQYEESDFDFISRWLEHEGIAYHFDHSGEKDKIVFTDANSAFTKLSGDFEYRQLASGGQISVASIGDLDPNAIQQEQIVGFTCTATKTPKKVVLNDYNWRTPDSEMKCESDVEPSTGFGQRYKYNQHYKNKSEGDRLAQVRAQEILCREFVFNGKSNIRQLRSGVRATFAKIYRESYNQEYLIVEVRHHASQSTESSAGSSMGAKYTNDFVAIPNSKVFRPACVTPWPTIKGTMNAVVDGQGGSYAEVDAMGRYKVKLPFDLSGAGGGNASRWMRMCQPYAGTNYGMHFPLHKGTEVVLTHIDGNPDRPMIVSAVPNPNNGSPVNSSNQSENVIRSAAGNLLTMDDTIGSETTMLSNGTYTAMTVMRTPGGAGAAGWAIGSGPTGGSGIGADASSVKPWQRPDSVSVRQDHETGNSQDNSSDQGLGNYADHTTGNGNGHSSSISTPPPAVAASQPNAPHILPPIISGGAGDTYKDATFAGKDTVRPLFGIETVYTVFEGGHAALDAATALFEGAMGKYSEIVGPRVDGGVGPVATVYKSPNDMKTDWWNFKEVNTYLLCEGSNTYIEVTKPDETGDQLKLAGESECKAAQRSNVVFDLTATDPYPVNSMDAEVGEAKETTKAKKLTSLTDCTQGAGKISETTKAKEVVSVETISTSKTETTQGTDGGSGNLEITSTTKCKKQTEETTISEKKTEKTWAASIEEKEGGVGGEFTYATKNTTSWLVENNTAFGVKHENWLGNASEIFLGGYESIRVAGAVEFNLGAELEVNIGAVAQVQLGAALEIKLGPKKDINTVAELKTFLSEVKTTLGTYATGLMTKIGNLFTSIGTP